MIQLRVLTDAGVAVEEQAVSVIAPGELGYVGFLTNHAPLVTTLGEGMLKWRRQDGVTKTARIRGGLLEIFRNRLTILTDSVASAQA
jgi:F-type H+-transporting ATPase subunit epsilon